MTWITKLISLAQESRRDSKLVHGVHVFGNLRGCDVEILKDEAELRKIIVEAAKIGNMTLVSIFSHKFGPESGVSVIAIVAESHISIHTWPEHAYATVDVYTCGAHSDPLLAFLHIAKRLLAKEVELYISDRSLYISSGQKRA